MIDLPPKPAVELSVATEGISKGLRQTEGPQVVGALRLNAKPAYVGVSYKNVDSAVSDGEAAAFVGADGKFGGFELKSRAALKISEDWPDTDPTAGEFTVEAIRKLGPVKANLLLVYSPDDLGSTEQTLFAEAGAAYEIFKGTEVVGALGRRERDGGPDYTAFNFGLSQAVTKQIAVDVRYYDTDEHEQGENYEGRVVARVRVKLP